MNGNIGQTYSDIYFNGNSSLQQAVNDSLKNVTVDINMNNHRIKNLGYPITNTDSANVQYVIDTFVGQGNPGQLAALNTINTALPLTNTLDLTNSNKQLYINNSDGNNNSAINKQTMDLAIGNSATQLQSNITAEQQARIAADFILQENITNERNDRINAIDSVYNSLNTEINNRITNDDLLQESIDQEITDRSTAISQTIQTCNNYSDNKDIINLQSAKDYTDNKRLDQFQKPITNIDMNNISLTNIAFPANFDSAISAAYLNSTLVQNNANQKVYIDAQDQSILTEAKEYTDSHIPTIDHTQIFNSTQNTKVNCSSDNSIDVTSNNFNLGKIYCPTGQPDNNFGILANNKLQLQSNLSSISCYGSKPLLAIPVINTHQLVVTGTDDPTKNVQSNINISNGSSQLNLSAGHFDIGIGQQNFQSVSGNSSLLLSGNQPLQDPTISLYSTATASAIGTQIPIQFTGKTGYSQLTTVDQQNQFTSKKYVDDQVSQKMNATTTLNAIASGNPADGNVSINNYKITNVATATLPTDGVNKQYVDSLISGGSSFPVGSIIAWYSNNIPTGWLLCNGQSFLQSTYPDLFALLGQNLTPNFSGLFLRGLEQSASPLTETQINRLLGDLQSDTFRSHNHQGGLTGVVANGSYGLSRRSPGGANTVQGTDINIGEPDVVLPQQYIPNEGGLETRPKNIAVNYIIRASISGNSQVSGVFPAAGNLNMSNLYKVTNLIEPTLATDSATKNYTDLQVATKQSQSQADSRYYLNTTALNSIAIPTGNLSMNSNRITSLSDPIQGQDAATRSWVLANTITGTPGKIQNGTVTSSSLTANSTELVSTVGLNMGLQKITALQNGTSQNDGVNFGQLQNLSFLKNGTMQLQLASTALRYFAGSNSDIINLAINGSLSSYNSDSNQFYSYSSGALQVIFDNNQLRFAKRSKFSTSSSTMNNAIYLDSSSISAVDTTPIMQITNSSTYTNGLQLNQCNITAQNSTEYIKNFNFSNVGQFRSDQQNSQSYFMGPFSPIDNSVQGDYKVIISSSGTGGYNGGLFVQNGILGNLTIYTGGSSRDYKRDITPVFVDDIADMNLVHYYYDENKCEQLGVFIDDCFKNKQQFGTIYEDTPARFQTITGENNQVKNIKLTEIKDAFLQYHQVTIRELKSTVNQQQQIIDQLLVRIQSLENSITQN